MIKIKGKSAIIFGGSGGIGLETASVLKKDGFNIAIGYHSDTSKEKLKGKLEDASFYKVDVSLESSVKDMVEKTIKDSGSVDAVVYSVSIPIKNKMIDELSWKDFQDHIDIQIKGFYNVVSALSPQIKSNKKIKFVVVLTEYCIGKPPSMVAHYVAAKYGLLGLTKAIAAELSNTRCTFNMVSPGMVNTELLSNLPPKLVEITAAKNPMKRIAEPSDVAKVISFLLSEDSDYLNGVNIPINGGNTFN